MVWKNLLITLAFLLISTFSQASVLQEGWYKIIMGGQHIGFVVLRYEFNESKKQFVATSFTQTNQLGGNLKESLIATSAQNLDPVSYQFTSTVGQLVKTIDASFLKGVLSAKVSEGGKVESIQNKLQKGTFLSQFLIYVVLQNPKGLKVGNRFAYSAVAEEDGKAQEGEAFVSGMEKVNGVDTYKILNTFKGAKYVSYVTPKGLILLTKSPTQSLSTELTASMEDATKGLDVNKKTLTLLFKNLPVAAAPHAPTTETAAPKTEAPTLPVEPNHIDEDKAKKLQEGADTTTPKGILIPPGKGEQPPKSK